jgi:hypothetical protein
MSPAPRDPEREQGRLRGTLLSPAYRGQLAREWAPLCVFVRSKFGVNLNLWRGNPRSLDRFLAAYVEHCYATQAPRGAAVLAVLAAQKRLRVPKALLPVTWEAAWAWKLRQPLRTRRPMPRAVLRAVVIVCLAQGFALGGALGLAYVSAAVLFWVGFETLLRPGEMLNLRRRDVILPRDVGTSRDRHAVIIVRSPKNQRHMALRHSQCSRFEVNHKTSIVSFVRFRASLRNTSTQWGLISSGKCVKHGRPVAWSSRSYGFRPESA